jgi:hypothetical protein
MGDLAQISTQTRCWWGSETRHIPKIPARSYPAWLGGRITSEYSVTRVQTLELVSYRSTIAFLAERRSVLFETPAISRIMSKSPPLRRLATISECLTIHKCQAFGMWPGRENPAAKQAVDQESTSHLFLVRKRVQQSLRWVGENRLSEA